MFTWSATDKVALPIGIATVFILAVLLRIILKNKSEGLKKLPLRILAVTGVLLEIAKQIYFIFIADSYITYALPFHFCTLILIMLPLAQFLPNKVARFIKAPATVFSLLVFALILIHPRSMIGNATQNLLVFTSFHTFAFHFVVVAYGVFSIFLQDYTPRYKDAFSLIFCVLFYASYGIPAAFTLKSNYIKILSAPEIPFLDNIRLTCGQVLYDVVLFSGIILIAVLVLFAYTFIYKKIKGDK
ncbi:MAG: YwaF family protein [Clostridia bacterium]|nr:YwaF family protein [Clostridia bacterium]